MNQQEAYQKGYDNGYGIGEYLIVDYTEEEFDKFFSECCQTESEHFRQFSPFEFTANEFNQTERKEYYTRTDSQGRTQTHFRLVQQDPDRMWEKYDSGVAKGIERSWRDLK